MRPPCGFHVTSRLEHAIRSSNDQHTLFLPERGPPYEAPHEGLGMCLVVCLIARCLNNCAHSSSTELNSSWAPYGLPLVQGEMRNPLLHFKAPITRLEVKTFTINSHHSNHKFSYHHFPGFHAKRNSLLSYSGQILRMVSRVAALSPTRLCLDL